MKTCFLFPCQIIGRLVVATAVAFSCAGIAWGIILFLDWTNVARMSFKAFEPYSSSLPWILIIVAVALLLCIPGGPTAVLSIFRRIKKIGPIELFSAEDPDVMSIVDGELSKEKAELDPKHGNVTTQRLISAAKRHLTPSQQKSLFTRLASLKTMKKSIVALHAGRMSAIVEETNVRMKGSELFFTAHLKRGEDHILVRILAAYDNDCLASTIRKILEIADMRPSCPFVFHVIFYSKNSSHTPKNVDFDSIRRIIFNVSSIRMFFYSVATDNSVKPLEIIP